MKHTCYTLRHITEACATAFLASVTSFSALAADPTPSADARARYEQERARCLSGTSGQAQSTCLKEAGAALDASKKGMLDDAGARYGKNAKERCDVLTGDEKKDCIARVKDAPNTTESGSVKGGGILRETVTVETKPVPPSAAASQ